MSLEEARTEMRAVRKQRDEQADVARQWIHCKSTAVVALYVSEDESPAVPKAERPRPAKQRQAATE
jgi:hypothetical protein